MPPLAELNRPRLPWLYACRDLSQAVILILESNGTIELPGADHEAQLSRLEMLEKLVEITLRVGHVDHFRTGTRNGVDASNPAQRFTSRIVRMHIAALSLPLPLVPLLSCSGQRFQVADPERQPVLLRQKQAHVRDEAEFSLARSYTKSGPIRRKLNESGVVDGDDRARASSTLHRGRDVGPENIVRGESATVDEAIECFQCRVGAERPRETLPRLLFKLSGN